MRLHDGLLEIDRPFGQFPSVTDRAPKINGSDVMTCLEILTDGDWQVTDNGKPVRFLNELEYVKGEVWANVWQTECIARINHQTGAVRYY